MNLNRSKVLMMGGGLCGAVLMIEVVFLVLALVGRGDEKRVLEQRHRQLSRLHHRILFPSKENEEALRRHLDQVEYRVGELAAGLVCDPFPQDVVEAADFSARAQGVIERFRKRAEQLEVFLPESIEVGFARYASGGCVPASQHVPRLSRQLYSVERVAEVLVGSGVASIDHLTRDMFEVEKVPDSARRRRPRRDVPASKDRTSSLLVATEVHPNYYIERVGVSFSAKEDAVWRVLGRLVAASHFMVLSEFSHTTQTDLLSYNPEAMKRGDSEDTLRYLAGGILVGETALSRAERMVAGNEIVQVQLVVEVYNFEPEAAGNEGI